MRRTLLAASLAFALPAAAQDEQPRSLPNTTILELKLGFIQPRVEDGPGLTQNPYVISAGYAEKYAKATLADGTPSAEATGLMIVPIRLMAVYRYDVLAHQFHIPLVPYAELGFVIEPWWTRKGGSVEVVDGKTGSGVKLGWGFTLGLALQLDFLNPTYAREARLEAGIYHFYLFGEFNDDFVNNFGGNGLNLSAAYWTFGIAFEF